MPNNAEILAQLGKLAEMERAYGPIEQIEFTRLHYSLGKTPDFPAILAAFKRLVKIEEAAKAHVDKRRDSWMAAVARGYNKAFATEHWPTIGVIEEGVDALAAALKEPQ